MKYQGRTKLKPQPHRWTRRKVRKKEIISCSELVGSMGRDSTIAKRKATSSFVTSVLPQFLRWHIRDRFSNYFIFWTSINILRFWKKS